MNLRSPDELEALRVQFGWAFKFGPLRISESGASEVDSLDNESSRLDRIIVHCLAFNFLLSGSFS